MPSTITGNIGGAAASTGSVQLMDLRTKNITFSAVDGSGNYTFTGLAQSKYQVTAFLAGSVYYHVRHVTVNGTATYSDMNLAPTALNASNNGV